MADHDADMGDITKKVKEYAEISKTIKVTQEKLKVLNKKKNTLQKEVLPILKSTNVTKCNLSYGTLKVIETNRKVVPNRASMKEKFVNFFNIAELSGKTPEQKADILFDYIYVDSAETKKECIISMTYSKEFKDQFKGLNLS